MAVYNNIVKKINENVDLHVLHLETISGDFKLYLDAHLVEICNGNSGDEIKEIKSYLVDYMDSKKDQTLELGSIAEFFIHLYLKYIGFKQECMFFNMEEGSIKKGFDGYYSNSTDQWIMESKSGKSTSKSIEHPSKIKEAFADLKNKIGGKSSKPTVKQNNPWRNAYNHAGHRDINSAEDLLKNLKKFSSEFQKGKYHDIKGFNVIPASTIFFYKDWSLIDENYIETEISKWLKKVNYSKLLIICINNKSKGLFWSYLQDE